MDHGKIRGPAQTRFFNDFGPETKETNKYGAKQNSH